MINKIRIVIGLIALVLLMISIFMLDYQNLSLTRNKSEYLNIIAMSLLCTSMYFSARAENSKKED
jgi:glucose uptake protein GlcU